MAEKDTDIFKDYSPSILPNPIKWIAHMLVESCSMHQLSDVSDHKFTHPFESTPEPVTHIEGQE